MDVLCADKTGTLTQNKLTLGSVRRRGSTAGDVIVHAALASRDDDADPIDWRSWAV